MTEQSNGQRLAALIVECMAGEKDKQVFNAECNARLKGIRTQMEGLSDAIRSGQGNLFEPKASEIGDPENNRE